jgi:hypothetical protein
MAANSREIQGIKNLDAENSYIILETEGAGNFVGCNHSVTHFQGVGNRGIQPYEVTCPPESFVTIHDSCSVSVTVYADAQSGLVGRRRRHVVSDSLRSALPSGQLWL